MSEYSFIRSLSKFFYFIIYRALYYISLSMLVFFFFFFYEDMRERVYIEQKDDYYIEKIYTPNHHSQTHTQWIKLTGVSL